jgi:hypothetical protein
LVIFFKWSHTKFKPTANLFVTAGYKLRDY